MEPHDIAAIQQVIALYGHAADADDGGRLLAQVFSVDAVFDARPVDAGLHVGLAEIQDWFALGKPPHPPSHQTTNVYVYVEEGTVRVKSKWLTVNPETGRPRLGDYSDTMVHEGGSWRIAHRIATGRFIEPGHFKSS